MGNIPRAVQKFRGQKELCVVKEGGEGRIGFCHYNCSLGLYQWSDKVVRKVERLWDIRDNKRVPHTVYLLVTPRVVVSITELHVS